MILWCLSTAWEWWGLQNTIDTRCQGVNNCAANTGWSSTKCNNISLLVGTFSNPSRSIRMLDSICGMYHGEFAHLKTKIDSSSAHIKGKKFKSLHLQGCGWLSFFPFYCPGAEKSHKCARKQRVNKLLLLHGHTSSRKFYWATINYTLFPEAVTCVSISCAT